MTREEQAQYIFEKLMENPEFRKAFVGAITDAVNEVVTVIKALEHEPCTDAISMDKTIVQLSHLLSDWDDDWNVAIRKCIETVKNVPPVTPQYTDAEIQKMQDLESAEIQKAYEIGKEEGSSEKPNKWIPLTKRPMTDEEREYYREWSDVDGAMIFDCPLPEDGQEVLVSYGGYVMVDTFCKDDGCYFEGVDIDDVEAWMPLPEPYKASPTGAERKDGEQE